ncbi:MAG: large-conductance mechanosensitive channel protein MscL [Pseudonocardiaceae bacterium]|nr:large-conductance mechanosensitive channel protein MscL [Pseudonocardiaceae bacterium]
MLKGFKEFLMRGNVIDLAVAVIIGTAFTAIVTSIVENLINPLIAATGGANVNGLALKLIDANNKTIIDFGQVITSVINFFVIAGVVYFAIVVPVQKIMERRKRGEEEEAEPTDVELLTEIRDLLREQRSGANR